MKVTGLTDVGVKRRVNQDAIFYSDKPVGNLPNLFIVADGMGGHKAGDFASNYAVKSFLDIITNSDKDNFITLMNEALQKTNVALYSKSLENPDFEGMGTTFVAATLKGNQLYVLNVGDSRLYIAGDRFTQITRDHSWVEEMVTKGEMAREEARTHSKKNLITRAVGADEEVMADFFEVGINPGEIIILCSDGLSNMVENNDIHEILKKDILLEDKGKMLVATANNNGGTDNISVVLIEPDKI
ncbi:MAG: Stp1/IreP family PP2C-type Ser/Thr phosphatase [Lachnospiraceae bacterium]|nr:Stp1/IreP family PP2C-type Ser/Thr phosphatase [Lachnospiraceae bacterium]